MIIIIIIIIIITSFWETGCYTFHATWHTKRQKTLFELFNYYFIHFFT